MKSFVTLSLLGLASALPQLLPGYGAAPAPSSSPAGYTAAPSSAAPVGYGAAPSAAPFPSTSQTPAPVCVQSTAYAASTAWSTETRTRYETENVVLSSAYTTVITTTTYVESTYTTTTYSDEVVSVPVVWTEKGHYGAETVVTEWQPVTTRVACPETVVTAVPSELCETGVAYSTSTECVTRTYEVPVTQAYTTMVAYETTSCAVPTAEGESYGFIF
ncbi:hypothetical protein EJ06DRAFT_263849 [Trichodelitschia bisporula]|uniref:Uncharacterized protein n=1 Tax=Trichodelitschia bisporula TaxID=703511 RepID=A0A6G1HJ38_9PEZI|nr:hypothetical protein EJ06DRAFT_263849 [Trichodelitschia bisporula]